MDDEQFKQWRETRLKGKLNFILKAGLLSYGSPMFIMMAIFNQPFAEGFTTRAAISHYITWPIAGLLFSVIMWHVTEHRYKKEQTNRSEKI
ncbi:hypothetical protein [Catenovulum adriaticum]|uniref:Solute:sodium symporter small subunit n=1 Tax=Catenovulum adriaticum TaxID=2984846 RepID=A0ABY7AVN3_9ALTE|nr:hypothetical protein [Catenovulum sp. TS8]WAJ72364.1 hypothetical protein OLW01_16630 [Catenovulum sp. TS8]